MKKTSVNYNSRIIHTCPLFLILLFLLSTQTSCAQPLNNKDQYTNQDSLRGSITPERAWWDVVSYAISITPDFLNKQIEGQNEIKFKVLKPGKEMQIDLQQPMNIKNVRWNNHDLPL